MERAQGFPLGLEDREEGGTTNLALLPLAPHPFLMIYLSSIDCPIKSQVPLATLTSFRVGGPAQWYVAPETWKLQASFEWAQAERLAVTLMGAGSNLLVSDRRLTRLSHRYSSSPLHPVQP